jgi:hypothetical protein
MELLKENEFQIAGYKNFKIRLSFQVMTWEDSFDEDVLVSCGEDIEEVMKLYFIKDWKTLFYDYNEKYASWYKDITDVAFEGIYITAKEEGKGHIYTMISNSSKVTVAVDLESMGDKNAVKINEIRSILNK